MPVWQSCEKDYQQPLMDVQLILSHSRFLKSYYNFYWPKYHLNSPEGKCSLMLLLRYIEHYVSSNLIIHLFALSCCNVTLWRTGSMSFLCPWKESWHIPIQICINNCEELWIQNRWQLFHFKFIWIILSEGNLEWIILFLNPIFIYSSQIWGISVSFSLYVGNDFKRLNYLLESTGLTFMNVY